MKKVIVIFTLFVVSFFGFSGCEDQVEEIQIDIEDTKRPSDNENEDDGNPGGN